MQFPEGLENTPFKEFFGVFSPSFNATFQCRCQGIFKKKINLFFGHKNLKKLPSKVAHNGPKSFFQYHQQAPIQPKSHFLFHKNVSLHNFYTMTLPKCMIIHILSRLAVKIYHKNLQKTRDLTYCIKSGYLDLVVYLLHYKLDILKSKAVL